MSREMQKDILDQARSELVRGLDEAAVLELTSAHVVEYACTQVNLPLELQPPLWSRWGNLLDATARRHKLSIYILECGHGETKKSAGSSNRLGSAKTHESLSQDHVISSMNSTHARHIVKQRMASLQDRETRAALCARIAILPGNDVTKK